MFDETTENDFAAILEEYKKKDRKAETFFNSLFYQSHAAMLIVDPDDGAILDANRRARRFYGYSLEQLTRMKITDLAARSLEKIVGENDAFAGGTKNISCFRHRLANGTVKDVEVQSGPMKLNGKKYFYSIVNDVSERKKTEKSLLASEKLLSDVFESIQDGVCVLDKDLRIVRVNKKIDRWYARNRPFEGKKCHECYRGRQTPCDPCPAIRALESGAAEHEIVRGLPGSPAKWVELYCYPIKDEKTGEITGAVEFVRDITDKMLAEEALKESEEKYKKLFDNAADAIFIAQNGIIKFPNKKTLEVLGYRSDELKDARFVRFIHPKDREKVIDMHLRRLGGETDLPATYSFRVINRSGRELTVELNTVKIQWEGHPATLNFVRDITKQKNLEASLYQAQKMEAIGTLAGGIAHDFNNLLMGIQGRASLMMLEMNSTHPFHEHVKSIEQCVKSASHLTKQLLGFARGGKYEETPAVINDIVEQTADMFARTRKEIRIEKDLSPDIWTVVVDRRQMEQVFLNLFVNAWQAMSGGGTLYLHTENVVIGEDFLHTYKVKYGNYVKVSVTDTGCGMTEAVKSRIFEPFFTTKSIGRGTGLGLASAYGIIKNHGGFINPYSEVGKGTTFNIYLPASDSAVQDEFEPACEFVTSAGSILLVDDEPLTIEVGIPMLERLGYKVYSEKNGKDAIESFKGACDEIDLVILDMIMPDMGGGEVFDRLKAIDPGVKVLLASGYSLNGQAAEIMRKGCAGFIQKPFSIRHLSEKIKSILDETCE